MDVFLDTWASTFFRESSYGAAGEMNGPGLPTTRPAVRPVLSVANGGGKNFTAPAYANAVYALSSAADVLTFTVTGHARLGDPAKHADYVLASGDSFCTKDGGCACPTHLYVLRANLILHFAVLPAAGLNQATGLAKIALSRV